MAAPYSMDLRKRVVDAVAAGMSRRKAARHYRVSPSTAVRWMERCQETGSPAALPMGGKRPFALADHADWIRTRLVEKPDITGRELLAELHERNVEVSYYGVWHFLDREGLSVRKNAARLIFIDETWAKTNMTRLHGRCPVGQRLVAKVPHGHWKTLTFVAGLRCEGIVAPCVSDHPVNAISFLAWVEQFLAPTLRRGDVVVMDNLSSHKAAAVRRAIRAKGALLIFLPAYSPDLNPIEQAFSQLKTLLRKENARTLEQTSACIGKLLDTITPKQCTNYFRAAGYAT